MGNLVLEQVEQLMCSGLVVHRGTLPFVLTVTSETDQSRVTDIRIVFAPSSADVDPTVLVPDGARIARADVLPASRLDLMLPITRGQYREQWIVWRRYQGLPADDALADRWVCGALAS